MVCRSFNAKSLTKGFTDLFNLPSILHPDIYNVTEKQAVDTFKFHNRVGRGKGDRGGVVCGACVMQVGWAGQGGRASHSAG